MNKVRGQQRLLPKQASEKIKAYFYSAGGFSFFLFSFFIFAYLLTYKQSDSSLNTASSIDVQNIGGVYGSYVADFLIQGVGLSSIFLPAVIAAWGWKLFRRQPISLIWARILLLLSGMLTFSTFLAIFNTPEFWPINVGLGGISGIVILNTLLFIMSPLFEGFELVLLSTVSLVSSIFALGFASGFHWSEWLKLLNRLNNYVLKVSTLIKYLVVKTSIDTERHDPTINSFSAPTNQKESVSNKKTSKGISKQAIKPGLNPNKTNIVADRKSNPIEGRRSNNVQQGKLVLSKDEPFLLPPLEFLEKPPSNKRQETSSKEALSQNAKLLETVLQDFGVKGKIVKVRPGPVVTLYELDPAPGTKTSRVVGLSDDIARSMSALSVRIAVVPGRSVIGIELPNFHRETVYFRELLSSKNFEDFGGTLTLILGKDIGGSPLLVDLARMPHLLIAGTTGSGKSVAINTMICSLLYRLTPDQCKFIMIDPKMLELSVYDGIPSLLTPVVTEPAKAVFALKWAVREMEERYRLMSQMGVRNITGYNARLFEAKQKGISLSRRVQTGFDENGAPIIEEQVLDTDPLPLIVIVVDEMADLMMVAGKDIEATIQRLAQMARAAGIHLIMATQRPSVDVITGTIKANFPTRVSFQVTSKIDSRTILGEQGAEQLLGQGDMLYMAGGGLVSRVHGPFIGDAEVESIVSFLKNQADPDYIEEITEDVENGILQNGALASGGDSYYDNAVALVAREGRASTSFIQRHLQIGYNRAATIMEQMEKQGVVSKADRVGRREVLVAKH